MYVTLLIINAFSNVNNFCVLQNINKFVLSFLFIQKMSVQQSECLLMKCLLAKLPETMLVGHTQLLNW